MPLRSLSLGEAFDVAIALEERSRDRYLTLARSLQDFGHDEVVRFFMLMAREEEHHRFELAAQRAARCPSVPPCDVSRFVPRFVGPHSQDEADRLTLRQALTLALSAERHARSFFLDALDGLVDAEARTLFGLLAEEEIQHILLVERELEALAHLELA